MLQHGYLHVNEVRPGIQTNKLSKGLFSLVFNNICYKPSAFYIRLNEDKCKKMAKIHYMMCTFWCKLGNATKRKGLTHRQKYRTTDTKTRFPFT